jgi:hypothetical protein
MYQTTHHRAPICQIERRHTSAGNTATSNERHAVMRTLFETLSIEHGAIKTITPTVIH